MKSCCFLVLMVFASTAFCQNNEGKVRMTTEGKINTFFKYDAIGRIWQIQQSDKTYFTQYTYLGDTTIVIQRKDFLDSSLTDILMLNTNKLVDFKTKIYNKNVFLFILNEYDANNKLVLQTVQSDVLKSRYEFKIENGNTVQQIAYDTMFENGRFQIKKIINNSLFSSKLNPMQKSRTGFLFEEKENKNLIISDTTKTFISDYCTELPCPYLPERDETLILKYDFAFDEKGRMTEYITTNTSTLEKRIQKIYYY